MPASDSPIAHLRAFLGPSAALLTDQLIERAYLEAEALKALLIELEWSKAGLSRSTMH